MNSMSHFSMFVPTKATLKLVNGNTGHSQGIGIILCCLPNCLVVYPVVPVCYCPGHPSNTILSSSLKFYISSKILHTNLFNIVTLFDLKVVLGDHPTRLVTILTIFTPKFSRLHLTETGILLSPFSVDFQNELSLNLFIRVLVMSL